MLDVRNISVSYGKQLVLSDVSLTLPEGCILALLGANGAGKTTLIKALNGSFLPEAGEIRIDGEQMGNLSRAEIARRITVVAQETETRFPVTVLEFVLSGRFAHGGSFGWENAGDISLAEHALSDCDLIGYRSRLMNELSGGERQRVVLARALATGATTLLLDEPTANLDLAHQAMMFRLVRDRCVRGKYSAIVITHDLNLAAEFAHEIVMLNCGRIVATGAPIEVLTTENIKDVFGVKVLLDENPASRKLRITAIY